MSRKRESDDKTPRKFKESPMRGRKISLEDRGPDAKKLGRKFKYEEGESERVVISLVLPKGTMETLCAKKKFKKLKSKASIVAKLIEKEIK